jgi:hypothetical protein
VGTRAEDAAGTSYSVALTAEAAPTVETASASPLSASVTVRGGSRWYAVNHAGGVLLAKAVGTADSLAGVTLWEASSGTPTRPLTPLAGVSSDVVAQALIPGRYLIEVNEVFGFTGDFTLRFERLDVSAAQSTLIGESDTGADSTLNDSCASADPIGGVPGVAVARLTEGDTDFFRFTATGPNVVIRTAAWGFDFLDTVLELQRQVDGGTTVIAVNDDEDPATGQTYSRIQSAVTAGQSYCIKVTGKRTTDSGSYAVVVTAN